MRDVRRTAAHLAGALAVLGVLALTACSGPPALPPSPSPTRSATPDPLAAERPVIAEARLALAQYDYGRAVELLAPLRSPAAGRLAGEVRTREAAAVRWPDDSRISHLFFHSLIVDPHRAFDGDADADGYDDYMVTAVEFDRILRSLYARGFVLVSPHDVAAVDDRGRMRYRPIVLPRGRTPIVLSQDDVDYYRYERGDGLAENLTVQDGRVVSTYRDGTGVHHGAYDVAPVVDAFVEQHPDFAYHGHKGVLAVTGYEGVLGYRTSPTTDARNPDRARDRAAATRVATALKAEGWEFASHSWGHIDDTTASVGFLQRDSARWDAEVRPIVGRTDLYVYPFGADIGGVAPYSGPKYRLLEQHGFRYFFPIDATTTHWQQLHGSSLRQARIDVDGIRLREAVAGRRSVLDAFFDPEAVFDHRRPHR
jgi:hypothetical protein